MTIYEEIVRECYWDSNITPQELQKLVNSKNYRELKKIFSKIIYNSNDKLKALKIFEKDQLRRLFDDFKITYNDKYIKKHVLVLRTLLLGESHKVKGLDWKKR